jgi:acyl carrier protein
MTPAEILAQINDILRDLLDDDSIQLTPETTSKQVAGWDSALHISLIVAVEHRFDIKFQTAELEELKDVGQLVRLVASKTS